MVTASYGEDPLWFSLGLPVGVMHLSQDHPCFIMSSILEKKKNAHTEISGALSSNVSLGNASCHMIKSVLGGMKPDGNIQQETCGCVLHQEVASAASCCLCTAVGC